MARSNLAVSIACIDRDGALLAASESDLLRLPTDGGPAAPLPTDGLPADFRVGGVFEVVP